MKKNESKVRERGFLYPYRKLSLWLTILVVPGCLSAREYSFRNSHLFADRREQSQEQVKEHVIKGMVTDAKGTPLPGVTIRLDGTTIGVASNNDGAFTLNQPNPTGTLVFSFVGFKTAKVPFTSGKPLVVKMEETVSQLDEVQVVAYGTQNKREMTGAMSIVKADEIKDLPSASVSNLLQGRVAGMSVINSTGAPGGGGTSVTIRGFSSISVEAGRRGSEPLWVIDGVPMYSFTSPISGLNTLSEIDPADIASLQVLKDAASASIYGSRAANGVILITTKQGRLNAHPRLSVNVSHTISFVSSLPVRTGGNPERRLRLEALENFEQSYYDEESGTYKYPTSYREAYEQNVHYNYFWNKGNGASIDALQDSLNPFYRNSTNWLELAFRTARVTDANIQLAGGSEKLSYNVGLGYYTESGVLRHTGFNRIKLLSNLFIKPFPKIESNLRFYVSRTGRNRSGKGQDMFNFSTSGDIETIPEELELSSLLPLSVYEETTRRLNESSEKSESYRLRTSFDLSYEFMAGLRLKSSLALDYSQQNQNSFLPSSMDEYGESYSSGQIGRNMMWQNENLLTCKQTFNDHTIDLLAGLSFQADENNSIAGYGKKSPSDLIHYVSWGGSAFDMENKRQLKEFNTEFEKSTMIGLFFRAGYNYMQKYLVSVTVRRDASSKFGRNTRWGTFPSYAIGYAFSEEPYMDWAHHLLDYGKIRLSYGTSGRQFESSYLAQGLLVPGTSFGGDVSLVPEWNYGLLNKDLTWEETHQWDAGLDLDFFNHRLGIALDYYLRDTKKLLTKMSLPSNFHGYTGQWQNAFGIRNSGIELQVKADLIRKDNLTWDVTVNFAHNWNKLIRSANGTDFINTQHYNNISIIGKSLNGILAYQDDGFYNDADEVPFMFIDGRKQYLGINNGFYRPGDRVIKDSDGNGKINSDPPLTEDRVYCGSPLPVAQGGIVSTLNWKGFDVNILLHYVQGQHLLNAGNASVGTLFSPNPDDLLPPVYADLNKITFWQKPGDCADFPVNRLESGLNNYTNFLSSNVEKVNYLKLKTLTVGYTLPEQVQRKIGCSVRFFVSGENLLTFTNYTGNDPESVDLVTGIDYQNCYPLAKKVTIGLILNF